MRHRHLIHTFDSYAVYGAPAGRRLPLGRRVTVHEWERAVLFRHGRFVTVLDAGAHRRWARGFTVRTVDTRPWVLLVPTQEIPTSDGVTVKVTVAGRVRVVDPLAFVTAARDVDQALYLGVQIALRDVVSTTTVEDLVANRADVSTRLLAAVGASGELGVAVEQLEVKDIVLPAELKKAQTELLVARAQGVAALERARGETAALRSLANAARIAADNPALVQLRLLQQLDATKGHTVVIGTAPFVSAPPA